MRTRASRLGVWMVLAAACGAKSDPVSTPGDAKPTAPAASPAAPKPGPTVAPVHKVEALEVLDLAGIRARAKASGKKRTLVALWATWCVPCIKEMPTLAAFYQAQQAKGFDVLGLCHDDRNEPDMAAKIQKVLDEVKVPFPMVLLKPGTDEALFKELGVEWDGGLPVTLVFDGQGNKVFYSRDAMTEALLASQVLPLLTQ